MSQKPDKPQGGTSKNKEVVISWNVPSSDLQAVDFFEIQWKKTEEKRWSGLACTDDNSTSIAIPVTKFEPNTIYQFRVKWTTKTGEDSLFSDISNDVLITALIPTRSLQQPGKVLCSQTTSTSATLNWDKPKGDCEVSYYNIKYRTVGGDPWKSVKTKQPLLSIELANLKSKSQYEFKVRAIFLDGNTGPFSDVSNAVTTLESLAIQVRKIAAKVGSGNPKVYKIPLTFHKMTSMTRKGKFGERDKHHKTKTIMVVGATGAGKSTLIDGMINYILDVSWQDDFRFTMIDLTENEKKKLQNQTKSQTDCITCYEVNYQPGSQIKYNLNIIDTPGFGDTRGIEQDKKIVDQIREFFMAPGDQGIDSIDAVCFIAQANMARLTHTQKYIVDSILSVFGKDIKDNIFVLATFADGKKPLVLAALKEADVPFQNALCFNSSALFESTDSSNQFSQMFWDLGMASFDTFFTELKRMVPRSLTLTTEVLKLRKQIENSIDTLHPQIQNGLRELEQMRKEADLLNKHKNDIADNKNFTYINTRNIYEAVPTKTKQYVTNCRVCNFTCHLDCSFPDDDDKERCIAMLEGFCTVCPLKCHWSSHKNNNFYYEPRVKVEEGTYEKMKEKYSIAVAGVQKQLSVLDAIKVALKLLGQNVISMMKTVRENINKLEQGALKRNPLNEENYLQLMIDCEIREGKPDMEARVQILEKFKKKAKILQKATNVTVSEYWTDEDVENFLKAV